MAWSKVGALAHFDLPQQSIGMPFALSAELMENAKRRKARG